MSGSRFFFVILFIASVALNVILLSGYDVLKVVRGLGLGGGGQSVRSYDASEDLREIAAKLGLEAAGKDAAEIASDVKAKIYADVSGKRYPRELLSDEQIEILKQRIVADKREILVEYQKFIKSLEGKRFVVVP